MYNVSPFRIVTTNPPLKMGVEGSAVINKSVNQKSEDSRRGRGSTVRPESSGEMLCSEGQCASQTQGSLQRKRNHIQGKAGLLLGLESREID
jgi:hypothetical protein